MAFLQVSTERLIKSNHTVLADNVFETGIGRFAFTMIIQMIIETFSLKFIMTAPSIIVVYGFSASIAVVFGLI